MFFHSFSSACGKPDTSRQVGVGGGGGVNITALNSNSSNLPRNQNLRITQSDPSRRDSMSQIRAILQIPSISYKSVENVKQQNNKTVGELLAVPMLVPGGY